MGSTPEKSAALNTLITTSNLHLHLHPSLQVIIYRTADGQHGMEKGYLKKWDSSTHLSHQTRKQFWIGNEKEVDEKMKNIWRAENIEICCRNAVSNTNDKKKKRKNKYGDTQKEQKKKIMMVMKKCTATKGIDEIDVTPPANPE